MNIDKLILKYLQLVKLAIVSTGTHSYISFDLFYHPVDF